MPPAATGLKALRVDPARRPGWIRGTDRTPAVGEPVYCVGGEGAVAALHGRTGDGSRLVEIQLGSGKTPFYAAASCSPIERSSPGRWAAFRAISRPPGTVPCTTGVDTGPTTDDVDRLKEDGAESGLQHQRGDLGAFFQVLFFVFGTSIGLPMRGAMIPAEHQTVVRYGDTAPSAVSTSGVSTVCVPPEP